MHFNNMKYIRPDFEVMSGKLTLLLDKLEDSVTPEQFVKFFYQIDALRMEIETMTTLCSIRHSVNTADQFYDDENDYWNEINPQYQSLWFRLNKISLNKQFKEELYEFIPKTFFKLAECQIKSFSEEILDDLQEENKLVSEYNKLMAKAKIIFDKEELNLTQLKSKFESTNRDLRKRAFDAYIVFFKENDEKFGEIYDRLVKVRDKMAKKLGYENFIELGYYRMCRLDYNQEMVSNYRRQILEEITPLAFKLNGEQAERLNLPRIEYYDFNLKYPSGNPKPQGTYEELVNAAKEMYHEMSAETKQFIDVMIDNELWDLRSKSDKAPGGYCTYIYQYEVPFIFSNFNGTSKDVDVLTHEAGHAFQAYMSRQIRPTSCIWPTLESCEIHSMSMEFFAYKWMEKFFKEDCEKYYHAHIEDAISFLPYGVLIDHFQHEVYKNPTMNNQERKACFRKLEKEYLPYKLYDGCDFLEEGGWWYQQGHIFQMPFYYIDYTLAQVCALQFFKKSRENYREAFNDYLHLCKLGGTMSFIELVKEAKLKVPFEDGSIKSIVEQVSDYLKNIDQSKF